jgi:phage gpG-like protein
MYLTSWNTPAGALSNGTTRKIQRLETLKKHLDGQRPLSEELAKKLREKILLDFTYHSNAFPRL